MLIREQNSPTCMQLELETRKRSERRKEILEKKMRDQIRLVTEVAVCLCNVIRVDDFK